MNMRYGFVLLFLAFLAIVVLGNEAGKRMTDQEMYDQMSNFIHTHSNIAADKPLVDKILASPKWAELVAQFGPLSKRHA